MSGADACIFCRIAKGDVPAAKVHEDAHSVAFLDIQPLRKGHTLVVPRGHYALLEEMPPGEAGKLFEAVREVARKAREATGASATTLAINNGAAAGQEVPHVHVHVVPRHPGDGGGPIHAMFAGGRPTMSRDDLSALAERMRRT